MGAPRARVARESVWARLGLMLPPAMPVAPAQRWAAARSGGPGGPGGAQTAMQVERWVRAAEPLRVAARSLEAVPEPEEELGALAVLRRLVRLRPQVLPHPRLPRGHYCRRCSARVCLRPGPWPGPHGRPFRMMDT